MKKIKPEISILLATFNRAHFILESLESVSKQTFKDWECLIIDDGSSDSTEQIVSGYIKNDKRFNYLRRPNTYKKGLPGSRNYGLDMAKGEYIIFFDDDDLAHPQNLEICLKQLHALSSDYCHYRKKSFTSSLPKYQKIKLPIEHYKIGPNQLEDVITNKIALASCTVMWRKECFLNIRFNESLSYAEEWECYTRILIEGNKGVGIDEVLYYNRKHPASNTGEFWEGDKTRRSSYEKSIKLIIGNLKERDLFSKELFRYFVQMSVFIKNKAILNYLLQISNFSFLIRLKYYLFFKFYPVLVVGHRAKKHVKKKLS